MAESSWMARLGARLVTNGYPILPIAPGTKKPGRRIRGKWLDYPDWPRHAARATTDVEVATWSAWPGCGIGILGGAVAALDIDIAEDAELALRIEQLARERLGDTPALRIGRAPKRLLVYRTAEPFRGIRRAPLEMLCLGQQFVAYAVHPDTGQPYAWPEEGLADLDIESLPVIDAAMAAAFIDEALALIPAASRPRSLRLHRSRPDAEFRRDGLRARERADGFGGPLGLGPVGRCAGCRRCADLRPDYRDRHPRRPLGQRGGRGLAGEMGRHVATRADAPEGFFAKPPWATRRPQARGSWCWIPR